MMSGEEKVEVHHSANGTTSTEEEPGPRTRKMTERGLEYTLQTKRKRLDQLCRGLEKNIDYLLELMDANIDFRGVQKGHEQWIALFDEFLTVNEDYCAILTPEETLEYKQNWYTVRFQIFSEFKTTAENWFTRYIKKQSTVDDSDKRSTTSSSSRSSKRSSKSNSTVVSALRTIEQKKAELEIKVASFQKRKELEEEKLHLRMKEEEIKLQEELALSEVQCKVAGDTAHETCRDDCRNSNISDESSALMAVVRHLSKPTSEIKKFGGNPLEFHRFMRQFQTRVVANCDNFDEKLNFLEQYTVGDAYKVVCGYAQMTNSKKGYERALKALDERYGDADVVVNAYIQKALNWPVIRPENTKLLDEFAIFLSECENAVENVESIRVLEYTDNFKKVVSKLPYNLHDKWRTLVHDKRDRGQRPSFHHLVKFVCREAKKVNDPMFGKDAMKADTDKHQKSSKQSSSRGQRSQATFATKVSDVKTDSTLEISKDDTKADRSKRETVDRSSAFVSPCIHCKGPHALNSCEQLLTLPYYDRTDILKAKGCCYGCLRYGHQRKFCKNKATCSHCQGRHPSVLHVNGKLPYRDNVSIKENNIMVNPGTGNHTASACTDIPYMYDELTNIECTMAIIPVKVKISDSNLSIDTYAFLDPGSNVSFIAEQLMYQLGAEGKRMRMNMDTMGMPHSMHSFELRGLEITDLDGHNSISLPPIYSKDKLPVSRCHIPTSDDLKQWSHLHDIELPQIKADIGLLIGNNIPDASTPIEVRTGPRGTPYATRSVLGWIPWNIIRAGTSNIYTANRVDVLAIQQLHEIRDLNQLYLHSVNLDFPERTVDDQKQPSLEDGLFLKKVSHSQKFVDGHFELCLPFRDSTPSLPNNKFMALQRLSSLKKKMSANAQFSEHYKSFMQTLLDEGFAERVPNAELQRLDGKTWYLPHHGVYNPNKPNKIRVVFDCSATCQGCSLNEKLLPGPDLANLLIGVLIKFRQELVAVQGDIEKMFYQVKVSSDDRDCMRYYWWPDGDINTDPVIHRMKVHLFGAVSSPSCANYALQQTIQVNRELFDPSVSQLASTNFYVDDFLCSLPTEEGAIKLIQDLTSMCNLGGFHVTKWMTNSRNVLESIPDNQRAKEVAKLDFEKFPTERVLGVSWDVETDNIVFNIIPRSCDATRRNILSIISSIYDPLGLVSPFILPARLLLQDLCRRNVAWDTILTGTDLHLWIQWTEELPRLAEIRIPRCLKSSTLGADSRIQLHHFADASESGYGTATYIRFLANDGEIHCSLLFGKARVAPLKKVTIPRMELTAAALAVKLDKIISTELLYPVDDTYFWTDSMAVIRYITNSSSRFQTFVANRLALIRESTELKQWRFVDGARNPADFASRGLRVEDINKTKQWIEGPAFLWKPQSEWPKNPDSNVELKAEDPEIKKSSNATVVEEQQLLDELLSNISSWKKLKRTLGWVLHYVQILRSRVEQSRKSSVVANLRTRQQMKSMCKHDGKLIMPLEMLQKAETILIKHVQQHSFSQEIHDLSNATMSTSHVKRSSSIYRLDPYLHDGIIRVGGRLQRSSLSYDAKHQILLPQNSALSRLILLDVHQSIGHQGKNSILAELRQKYWIPRAGQICKGIVSKCISCRRYRTHREEQKMADLPEDRIVPGKPFSDVGVDYFGPIEIKRGRTLLKRYGVIFSCCKSRAVHLEVASSLTTDSCINAIRRFIARRGPVDCIRSDNGTNLVGAEHEMKKEIQLWNQSKLGKTLQQHNIDWKFNPPAGSHFGGFWERLIRSVRKIFYSLLRDQSVQLDDEGLQTLMCEVELILNNRPLTLASDDPKDLETLSPSHILMMKPNSSMPPGIFESSDNYTRRRWRQLQHIANLFWTRWTREYLPLLQKRQKWFKPHRNVTVGDIVLITDNSPRNVWPMARVTDVHQDCKGIVRVVTLQTKSTTLQRPVDKLCLLLEADN